MLFSYEDEDIGISVPLTLFWFSWRTWFRLIFSKSARNKWLLKYCQSWGMLYLVGVEFEKKSGNIWDCEKLSNILNVMLPEIVL